MLVDFLDDGIGLNQLAVAVVVEAMRLLESRDFTMPGGVILAELHALAELEQVFKVAGQYADVVPADALDLADFGNVDVKVGDVLRVRGETSRVACDAIIETSANGDQEIAVFDRVVG